MTANEERKDALTHTHQCRKMSDGMFLHACRQVAKEYPHIKYDEDLLDRACLRIVQDPAPYADRVMVMPNLYGTSCYALFIRSELTPVHSTTR